MHLLVPLPVPTLEVSKTLRTVVDATFPSSVFLTEPVRPYLFAACWV